MPHRPLFLKTTATHPKDYVQDLANLVVLSFSPESILRGSTESFRQREIEFTYLVVNTSNFIKKGLPFAIKKLKGSTDSIVIFVNTRTKAMHLTSKMEKMRQGRVQGWHAFAERRSQQTQQVLVYSVLL